MQNLTWLLPLLATCFAQRKYFILTARLIPLVVQISRLIVGFHLSIPTPAITYRFENDLDRALREIGRIITEWSYNSVESRFPCLFPTRFTFQNLIYRKRTQTSNHCVQTLFGTITLCRYLYQPLEPGSPSIFLLELRLGLDAGYSTPALTERISFWTNDHPQEKLLQILAQEYGVSISVETLREIVASISQAIAETSFDATVEQLLLLLAQAFKSSGPHDPVIGVGRDGVFIQIRGEKNSKEAAAATITIYDRNGERLQTIYLGRMPEAGQESMDKLLTRLIETVLKRWEGPMPQLAYITDDGYHQSRFFHKVLSKMRDPKNPTKRLVWIRVVDFWHMCEYLKKLANQIFGEGAEANKRAEQWIEWAKTTPNGLQHVLRSAGALKKRRGLKGTNAEYKRVRNYIRKNLKYANYYELKQRQIPIGSGVTEAACKTVFTQRFKCSGMKWSVEGGQRILDLRVVFLSKTWKACFQRVLTLRDYPELRSQATFLQSSLQIAA